MAGPVSHYLALFPVRTTRTAYHTAMGRYFTFLAGGSVRSRAPASHGPDALAEMDAAAVAYLAEVKAGARSAADDLVEFLAVLQAEYSPSSIVVNRSAVVGFLEENGIELSRLEERRIKKRVPRHRNVAEEEIITRDHLQALLPLLSIRDRAVALVMLASGGRIGEVLQLRLQDVDLEGEPARVVFRAATTKNKERRISFLTGEAVEAMRAWLTVRSDYLQTAVRRNLGLVKQGHSKPKSLDDARLFPFSRASFDLGWKQALERAGLSRLCETTQRRTIHPHGLRKAFRSWFGAAAGPDAAEVLMGHSGYLETYRKYTEEDLRQAYAKHSHVLCIVDSSGDLARQVAEQQAEVDRLTSQNATLTERLTKLETDMQIAREVRTYLQEREQGAAQ